MIEVTDEMITKVVNYFNNTSSTTHDDRVWLSGAIKLIIELHEANKPKLEPYCYMSKTSEGEFFPTQNQITENDIPIYTTPPTRERLSEHELNNILFNLSKGSTLFDLARTIEQAHGIGTTNDQPQTVPTR